SRVGYGTRTPGRGAVERELMRLIAAHVARADVVLVSDYAKGVCTPALLAATIAAAKARGLKVLADPTRGGDYRKYHGCSAITPNRLDAGLAVGAELATSDDA